MNIAKGNFSEFKKTPLDRAIAIIKEELMTANPAGQGGGFSGKADAAGPTAGFDPIMGFKMLRRKSGKVDKRGKQYRSQYDHWLRSNGLL